jgi:putative peptidoglycan lipid II flippase
MINEQSSDITADITGYSQVAWASFTLILANLTISLSSFIKNIVIAHFFGTSGSLDSYYAALTLPALLNCLIIGSIQVSFIPVFIQIRLQESEKEAHRAFDTFFSIALVVLLAMTCLLVILAPWAVYLVAPGFEPSQIELTIRLLRILSPLLILSGIFDLITFLFNAYQRFALPGFSPLVGSVVSIIYLLLAKDQGIYALAYGLILGLVIQLSVLLLGLGRGQIPYQIKRFSFDFKHPAVIKIGQLMGPMLLGASFTHLTITVDRIMASFLPEGSISALNYADKLNNLPMQMFILGVGGAILPFFSQHVAEDNIEGLKKGLSLLIRMSTFFLLPLTMEVALMGKPLIELLFQRGAFDTHSTLYVARAWTAYAIGLVFCAIGVFIARMFSAMQNTKVMMFASLQNLILNIIFNLIFMRFWGHVGIALSTSVTYLFSMTLMIILLKLRLKNIGADSFIPSLVKISIITIFTGILQVTLINYFILPAGSVSHITYNVGIALPTYLLLSSLAQSQEIKLMIDLVRRKSLTFL